MKPTRRLASFFHSQKSGTVFAVLVSFQLSHSVQAQTTGFNQTGAGPFDYNNATNWVSGGINGLWDTSLTLTATQTATFGADTTLTTGLDFNYAGNFDLTLRSEGTLARTLTLGGNIAVAPASNRTINFGSLTAAQALNVNLGGNRTFTVGNSKVLNFFNTISGGNLTIVGSSSTTTGGTVRLSRTAANAAGVNIVVGNNATFQIDNSANGYVGATRANSLTLTSGGKLSVRGNSTNTVEILTGALTTDGSGSRPKSSANAYQSISLDAGTGNTLLSIASLARAANGTLLVRGDNLGLNSIASATAGSSNLQITGTAPAMVGGGGAAGTTNISIVPWLVGGINLADVGSTLATYSATNGLRPLDVSTEFAGTIGARATDNVRLTATADTAIAGNQTVNALVLSGSGGSISGTAPEDTLTVTSGTILLTRTTGVSSNINVNLNFGAAEGLIGFIRGDAVNGAIAGSGGLTIHGNRNDEVLQLLNGASTYTGNTTILSNAMVATGFLPNGSRTGDVYVYGNLQLATFGYAGTINGLFGTGVVAYSNSGISSLTIGDNDATSTFSGSIVANDKLSVIKTGSGTLTLVGAHKWARGTELRGGVLSINSIADGGIDSGLGNSANTATNLVFSGGTLSYTGASATSDRAFTINSDKTATIETTNDLTLAGSTGAASNGALNKTGTGNLILSGANTHTGATTVTAGKLVINGSTSTGTVTVKSEATLGGSGTIGGATTIDAGGIHAPGNSPGVQKFTSSLTYDDASIFSWEVDHTLTQTRGTGYDGVDVTGALSGTGGAVFRIMIGDNDFSNAFWATNRSWTDIFTEADGTTPKDWTSIFGGGFEYYNTDGIALATPTTGSFTFTGSSTLSWSAVPEPTSALAGLLLGAGLLRRRRSADQSAL